MTNSTRWMIVVLVTWWVGGPAGLVVGAMAALMNTEPGANPSFGLFWVMALFTMALVGWATARLFRPAR